MHSLQKHKFMQTVHVLVLANDMAAGYGAKGFFRQEIPLYVSTLRQSSNVADGTSVVWLLWITFEDCNFTLNIFQDFLFTYFKHERQSLLN